MKEILSLSHEWCATRPAGMLEQFVDEHGITVFAKVDVENVGEIIYVDGEGNHLLTATQQTSSVTDIENMTRILRTRT